MSVCPYSLVHVGFPHIGGGGGGGGGIAGILHSLHGIDRPSFAAYIDCFSSLSLPNFGEGGGYLISKIQWQRGCGLVTQSYQCV